MTGWLKAAQYLNRGNCLHGSTQHCWLWVHCDARDDVCSCVKTNRDVHADTSSSSFQWATAVNRCKTRMLPLDSGNCLEIIIGLFPQCIWVGLCTVYTVCLESPDLSGELYITLHYIGKPEKFPPQRGVNIEKRLQVSPELIGNWSFAASVHAVTTSTCHQCHTARTTATLTFTPWVYCIAVYVIIGK